MTSVAIGLASGLGNAVFMLPAIKVLSINGANVLLHVQTDFPTAALFKRCKYANEVIEPASNTNGHLPMCGQWRPAAWRNLKHIVQYQIGHPYRMPEWRSNLRLAGASERVDVSDWCRDVDRTPRWDVGIVPGSKGGIWLRKRWPGMKAIAEHYLDLGARVAVFGTDSDGAREVPGESVLTPNIATLPDVLAGCRVIIGTDSGVTHLASSLGIPVVVIYTATSEVKGDPVGMQYRKIRRQLSCYPCQSTSRWYGCHDWKCRDLDIEEIIQAAEDLQ